MEGENESQTPRGLQWELAVDPGSPKPLSQLRFSITGGCRHRSEEWRFQVQALIAAVALALCWSEDMLCFRGPSPSAGCSEASDENREGDHLICELSARWEGGWRKRSCSCVVTRCLTDCCEPPQLPRSAGSQVTAAFLARVTTALSS